MIHTFELLLQLNYLDIDRLFWMYGVDQAKFKYFGAAVKSLNREIKNRYKAYAVTWIDCHGKDTKNLHLKVDAIKLLGRGDVYEEDYPQIESDVRRFLIYHFGHSDCYDSHTLTRIDYKKDVKIKSPKERELLFHLLEKYTDNYRYKEKIKWGKDKNETPLKYETTQYHKNKSVELVIYSKEEERIAKGEEIHSYDENVVRYEFRLKNSHLNSMKRTDKGIGRPKHLKTYFSSRLQKKYMEKDVLPIIHKGDYYKITEAEKIIEKSQFSRTKKERLRDFLVLISRGSIDTPAKHMSKPTYRQYLRDLETLGINPVLIPKNRSDFPSYMKNPFQI